MSHLSNMDKQSNTLCASCKSFEGCWKTKVSAARVPATILGRDAPALMAFIFHSLPLALFVELVPFIHQMQPLQGVFRQVLVKVRNVLLCTISKNGSMLFQPLVIPFFSVLPSVTWHLC